MYKYSRDYKKLYELLKKGCEIQAKGNANQIMCDRPWYTGFIIRLHEPTGTISGGNVLAIGKLSGKVRSQYDELVSQCMRFDIQWIEPEFI